MTKLKGEKNAEGNFFRCNALLGLHYENAIKAVAQIRAGEWIPKYNDLSRSHLCASRGDLRLWIGNGPWYCDIDTGYDAGCFGFAWRHYVWWAAARKLKRDSDLAMMKEIRRVPIL